MQVSTIHLSISTFLLWRKRCRKHKKLFPENCCFFTLFLFWHKIEATRNERPFPFEPPSQRLLAVHARLCQTPVAVESRLIMWSHPPRGLLVCVSFRASHSAGLLSCPAPKSRTKNELSIEKDHKCMSLRSPIRLSNAVVELMSR